LLLQKKAELKHGEFQLWIEKTCEFSIAPAKKYMRGYRAFQKDNALSISSLRGLLETDKPQVSNNSGNNEWYTPENILIATQPTYSAFPSTSQSATHQW